MFFCDIFHVHIFPYFFLSSDSIFFSYENNIYRIVRRRSLNILASSHHAGKAITFKNENERIRSKLQCIKYKNTNIMIHL